MPQHRSPFFTSLRNLQTAMPEKLQEATANFRCEKDGEMAEFLKGRASLFEEKGKSRTYLLLDNNALRHGEVRIVAFFSVAPQVMFVQLKNDACGMIGSMTEDFGQVSAGMRLPDRFAPSVVRMWYVFPRPGRSSKEWPASREPLLPMHPSHRRRS